MKTAKIIFAALVMVALMTSCMRESESNDEITSKTMEFTAAWAEEDASRTVLQGDGTSIWWTVGEEINLFVGKDVSAKFISTNTQPQHIVSFAGNVMIGYPEDDEAFPGYWAVYPYNKDNSCDGNSVSLKIKSRQAATAGTFADKCFPAVARSINFSLAFWNVCGGARFSVTREGIKRVVIRSNDGSPMAGKVRVGFGEDGKPQILDITEPVDSVVLNAKDGLIPGANYFAVMLPQTHAQGLSVTLYTANRKAVKRISKPISIHRSAFGMQDNVDEGLTYVDATLPEDDDDDTPFEMVDLGLSVKWATCNIGASSPEEYGDAFAWGETKAKEDYSWETYKWCRGSENTLTKYCNYFRYGYNGFTDNNTVLDPEDDAATVKWGSKWRIPTYDEWIELRENCTWKYTTLIDKDGFGVVGYKVMSNKTGHSDKWIFLPFSADRNNAGYIFQEGKDGFWSSSISANGTYYAYDVLVYASNVYVNGTMGRDYGRTIRPVYGDMIHVTGISVSPENVSFYQGRSIELTATIIPSNAHEKGLRWSSSDETVATVNTDGRIYGISAGKAVITVTTVDGGFTASCTVTVVKSSVPDAIDLGLSVKWASCNVGAFNPEECGDYFAWGETESKENYNWVTYKWCINNSLALTKYCSSYGYLRFWDNKTKLDLKDDAAAVNWGGSWRMPTYEEFEELRTQCTWTWTTLNGVKGRKVISKIEGYTNNWIFLPAAGYWNGTSLSRLGIYGSYWSSSISTGYSPDAYHISFSGSSVVECDTDNRMYGYSVRPVYNGDVSTGVNPGYNNPYTGGEDW